MMKTPVDTMRQPKQSPARARNDELEAKISGSQP